MPAPYIHLRDRRQPILPPTANSTPQPAVGPRAAPTDSRAKPKPAPSAAASPAVVVDHQSPAAQVPGVRKRMRAAHPYTAQREDELSIQRNDELFVLEEQVDGWCRCSAIKNGNTGWLPLNFLIEVEEETFTPPGTDTLPTKSATTVSTSSNGDAMFADSAVMSCATVMYDFTASQPNQLTLRRGDVIWILEKTNNDWWQARTFSGLVGFAPAIYVREESELQNMRTTSQTNTPGATMEPAVDPNEYKSKPWYHGDIPREQSEAILKEAKTIGSWLVRASAKATGVISVNVGSHIEHFPFLFEPADAMFSFGPRRFESVFALKDYYETNAIFTLADKTQIFLKKPIDKKK